MMCCSKPIAALELSFIRVFLLVLGWSLGMQGEGVMAGFTTSGGVDYMISDTTQSYSSSSSACTGQNAAIATFTKEAEYRDLIDYLIASGAYNNKQIWVSIDKVGSTYYFAGGDEIGSDNWYSGEPNLSCTGTCCHRLVKKMSFFSSASEHKLADNSCTKSYYTLCRGLTTTTAALTTTAVPTTTALPTTTTAVPTTITAVATTTTTAVPTTTTAVPTLSRQQHTL